MTICPFPRGRLLVAALALVALGATVATAQANPIDAEDPFISHGAVQETSVNVTVRARPGDHCVVYWSIRPGVTNFPLPRDLGGPVALGLDPAWLFASTLEGTINFKANGTWTFSIPHLDLIRQLVSRLYFQVLVFRPGGTGLIVRSSTVLELPTSISAEPRSGLAKAFESANGSKSSEVSPDDRATYLGKRRGALGGRQVGSPLGVTRRDPFGNIIREPGNSLR